MKYQTDGYPQFNIPYSDNTGGRIGLKNGHNVAPKNVQDLVYWTFRSQRNQSTVRHLSVSPGDIVSVWKNKDGIIEFEVQPAL